MNIRSDFIFFCRLEVKAIYFYFLVSMVSLPCFGVNAQKVIDLKKHNVVASDNENQKSSRNNARLINNILKAEQNTFSIIQLPAGRIWFAEPIIIPSGVTLQGNPAGSVLVASPSFGQLIEGFIVNENYELFTPGKDEKIQLRDFTIDGNYIDSGKTAARGIYFNKVHEVVINNLKVINISAEGIRIDASNLLQTTEDVTIENCLIKKRGTGSPCIMVRSFTFDGTNSSTIGSMVSHITIKGNQCYGGGQGILLFNVATVYVYNNICIANLYRGIIGGPTCLNITVRKNRVDSSGSTGIHFAYFSKNIIIDSNFVSNSISDMSGKGGEGQGIKAYAGFTNIRIANNTCNGNATDGIALEGGGYGNGFVITGNSCEKNKRNGIRIWAGKLYDNKKGNIENGLIEKNELIHNLKEAIFISSDDGGKSKVKNTKARSNKIILHPGQKKFKVEHTSSNVIIQN